MSRRPGRPPERCACPEAPSGVPVTVAGPGELTGVAARAARVTRATEGSVSSGCERLVIAGLGPGGAGAAHREARALLEARRWRGAAHPAHARPSHGGGLAGPAATPRRSTTSTKRGADFAAVYERHRPGGAGRRAAWRTAGGRRAGLRRARPPGHRRGHRAPPAPDLAAARGGRRAPGLRPELRRRRDGRAGRRRGRAGGRRGTGCASPTPWPWGGSTPRCPCSSARCTRGGSPPASSWPWPKHYPDEHPVVLVRAAGVPGQETLSRRPLYEVDRDDFADHLTSLWVPPWRRCRRRASPRRCRR